MWVALGTSACHGKRLQAFIAPQPCSKREYAERHRRISRRLRQRRASATPTRRGSPSRAFLRTKTTRCATSRNRVVTPRRDHTPMDTAIQAKMGSQTREASTEAPNIPGGAEQKGMTPSNLFIFQFVRHIRFDNWLRNFSFPASSCWSAV